MMQDLFYLSCDATRRTKVSSYRIDGKGCCLQVYTFMYNGWSSNHCSDAIIIYIYLGSYTSCFYFLNSVRRMFLSSLIRSN